ncbi:MAG TPA: hypothetical protein VL737_05085 [Candidatus Pristimantibacillus sp.]|jgi:hypothetical protein|nr:hypothetical protein [Candidatus Pristimantibacillus sp.]
MKVPASLPAESIAEFAASPKGAAMIDGSVSLQEVLSGFCTADVPYRQDAIQQHPDTRWVGVGEHSEVWRIDGVAVKASTHSTGRGVREKGNGTNGVPEDLIDQFNFMSALGLYLDAKTRGALIVPDQYFALGTKRGDYLSGQQFMDGWLDLEKWAKANDLTRGQIIELYRSVQTRILDTVGDRSLRLGLFDLGLASWRRLHAANVLIHASSESAETDPLCIIDQPSHGITGKLGLLAVSISGLTRKAA